MLHPASTTLFADRAPLALLPDIGQREQPVAQPAGIPSCLAMYLSDHCPLAISPHSFEIRDIIGFAAGVSWSVRQWLMRT